MLFSNFYIISNRLYVLISIPGKIEPHASSFNMGYLVSPYSYSNGGAGGLPVTMVSINIDLFYNKINSHLSL